MTTLNLRHSRNWKIVFSLESGNGKARQKIMVKRVWGTSEVAFLFKLFILMLIVVWLTLLNIFPSVKEYTQKTQMWTTFCVRRSFTWTSTEQSSYFWCLSGKKTKRLFLKSEILRFSRKGQLFLTVRKVKKVDLKALLWVIFWSTTK